MDWDRVWAFFHRFKARRAWALALMVPNLAGIGFGYHYYHQVGQFDPASPYFRSPAWWPLIPDSPNAVVLMSASLLLYAFGRRRSRLLDAAAFLAMVYVGVWTTFLFLAYPQRLGTFDWAGVGHGNANPILFVSHMGMPLQALLLVRDLRRDAWPPPLVLAVLGGAMVGLALDYWGPHLHPAPFLHDALHLPPAPSAADALLHAGSPWIMACTLAAWLAIAWPGLGVRSLRRGGGPSPPPSP
ncbi:MAG TPA: DUF1405 domain-containing protein [Candidatus Thermoplasmatota archaeon]|nr:DUF1405 domain-containing protein [Candidatus Thermoplasmatota archaeon]